MEKDKNKIKEIGDHSEEVERLFEAYDVYSDSEMAEIFSVTPQAVSFWRKEGIPKKRITQTVREGLATREWILYKKGPAPISKRTAIKESKPKSGYQSSQDQGQPPQVSIPTTTISSILELRLYQTKEVLESNTPYATALDANILAFHRSIHTEKRVAEIEAYLGLNNADNEKKLDEIEQQLKINSGQ